MLVYDPRDKSTRVVADGIYFSNGVALSPDESFLVVGETFGCRLLRVWLRGEKAGTTEVRCAKGWAAELLAANAEGGLSRCQSP